MFHIALYQPEIPPNTGNPTTHRSGNAAYGDFSWFPRVSHVKQWIISIVPTARFIK